MNKFTRIVSKVLKINPRKISDRTSPADVDNWDSFRGILLISEIEEAFGVKFLMDEIMSIRDIGGIKKLLKNRNINPDE